MSYRFKGDYSLVYPAYLDLVTGHTLTADPQGTYDMQPAAGRNLPVPPDDGKWETVTASPAPAPAPVPSPPPVPPAVVTTPAAPDEGK